MASVPVKPSTEASRLLVLHGLNLASSVPLDTHTLNLHNVMTLEGWMSYVNIAAQPIGLQRSCPRALSNLLHLAGVAYKERFACLL